MVQIKTLNGSSNRLRTRDQDDFFRLYGNHPLAYQSLDSNLDHFLTDNGYLSYCLFGKACLVLGDPVAQPGSEKKILQNFVAQFPDATFVQINQSTASVLDNIGFNISSFGVETSLTLPFDKTGNSKADIRHLFNSGFKAGIKVRDIIVSEQNIHEHFESNNSVGRFKKPMYFLAHSEIDPNDNYLRLFVGFVNQQPVGMSLFAPMFTNEKVTGYVELLPRRTTSAPKGTRAFILIKAMETLQKEGIEQLNLGLSPFALPKNKPVQWTNHGVTTETILRKLFNYGSLFFNFKGLAFHKSRFRGEETETFFASRSRYPIKELLKIYRITTGNWIPPLF